MWASGIPVRALLSTQDRRGLLRGAFLELVSLRDVGKIWVHHSPLSLDRPGNVSPTQPTGLGGAHACSRQGVSRPSASGGAPRGHVLASAGVVVGSSWLSPGLWACPGALVPPGLSRALRDTVPGLSPPDPLTGVGSSYLLGWQLVGSAVAALRTERLYVGEKATPRNRPPHYKISSPRGVLPRYPYVLASYGAVALPPLPGRYLRCYLPSGRYLLLVQAHRSLRLERGSTPGSGPGSGGAATRAGYQAAPVARLRMAFVYRSEMIQ